MNHSHLNDEQMAAAVVEDNAALENHLHECAECSARVEKLRTSLNGFGQYMRESGEHTNSFWWRQRMAQPAPAFSFARWAMAGAAVVIAAAVSMPFLHQTAQVVPPQQVVTPAQVPMSDEALLNEVQTDTVREYPDALAPVETNAESAIAAQSAAVAPKKEHKKKK